MKRVLAAAAVCLFASVPLTVTASPADDVESYRDFFAKRFPGVPLQEFSNGVYAIDEISRESWEAIEDFPPYDAFVEEGEEMYSKPFANGKGYADCFSSPGVAAEYPRWEGDRGMVVTLALAINECREANGEEPLKYKKGKIASLLAYMNYESRGQVTNVDVPMGDPGAVAAYEEGKQFYFARRGQLNMSCAHCHMMSSGQHIRMDVLSPALGHTTGWPVYRSKWGNLGTLHRRFDGCNKQVRAKPFAAQGEEYRNLEYFLTHMSNGIELNGPSARK